MPSNVDLAARLLNKPLLIEPRYAASLISHYAREIGGLNIDVSDGDVIDAAQSVTTDAALVLPGRYADRPYRVVDGVAIIPINGSLYHKWGWLGSYSAGYDAILHWVDLALADNLVKGILFDFDSPGGELAGCFDCVETLAGLRGKKPFWGLINDMCASAAFAISSACDRRLITQTGNAGSVGVVAAHISYEQMDKDQGVVITLIHAGARKVDGNPYKDLPADVAERWQSDVDASRVIFADLVSANISGLSAAQVLATEAGMYTGQAAIDIGFADELVNGNDAVRLFSESLSSGGRVFNLGANMATSGGSDSVVKQGSNKTDKAENADQVSDKVKVSADAGDDAGGAERERIEGILTHAEASGRSNLATHLAFKTDMSVDDAGALLASTEAESQEFIAGETSLDIAMGDQGNPDITADAGANIAAGREAEDQSDTDRMMANFNKSRGLKI